MHLRKVKLGEKYYSASAGCCDDTKPCIAVGFVDRSNFSGGVWKCVEIERPDGSLHQVFPVQLTPWDEHAREQQLRSEYQRELQALSTLLSDQLDAPVELELDAYDQDQVFVKFSEPAAEAVSQRFLGRPLPASARPSAQFSEELRLSARVKASARVRRALGVGRAGRFPASRLDGDQAACLLCTQQQLERVCERLGCGTSSVLPDLLF